ncbi:hypothetical protein HGRIS_011674 [Hohenbuehelia grisea]|uniref:Uncharacterized protein n=1 Tax=Hohenbuehelia grisea TaxID=104357 RepID=A0ABR3JY30_9AGAR
MPRTSTTTSLTPSSVMKSPLRILSLLAALGTLPLASSYSFNIENTPAQCQNLSISITGSGGQAPYRALIVPFGPSTLPNNIEVRRITEIPFGDGQTKVSFKLNYPENTQFVAVVSDGSGFGSGGTSVAATVLTSSDSSCFNSNQNVSPDFFLNIEPPNQIVQCAATRIWWDPATVRSQPSFFGVIPGGQSFAVPNSTLSTVPNQGQGFNWTPSLRTGTTLILVGGDSRGAGTGGSVLNTVSAGINPDGSCLNDSSPSSTPGSPAGGSYPTSTNGAGTSGGGGGGGGSNTGAIVGGVIGGIVALAALILVLIFWRRSQRKQRGAQTKERPVDLLQGDPEDDARGGQPGELPQYYQPEPFMVPDPTVDGSSHAGGSDGFDDRGRPLSGATSTSRSGTPDILGFSGAMSSTSTGTRKTAPRPLRPVNIIQHDDAGPSEAAPKVDDPETIELPPAYTNIRPNPSSAPPPEPAAPAA